MFASARIQNIAIVAGSLIAIVALVALGAWQMLWMQWQDHLTQQSQTIEGSQPISIDDLHAGLEYGFDVNLLRVRLDGFYRHDLERYVSASQDGVPGYRVITPFIDERGYIVLVDRGWVSEAGKNFDTRADRRNVEGKISVTGISRINATSMMWSYPPADEAKNIWYWFDRRAIASSLPEGVGNDGDQVAVFAAQFVQIEPGGEPGEGRLPQISVLNVGSSLKHLAIAGAAFVLAMLMAGWLIHFFWIKRKSKPPAAPKGAANTNRQDGC